jgi:hypothetical protein
MIDTSKLTQGMYQHLVSQGLIDPRSKSKLIPLTEELEGIIGDELFSSLDDNQLINLKQIPAQIRHQLQNMGLLPKRRSLTPSQMEELSVILGNEF